MSKTISDNLDSLKGHIKTSIHSFKECSSTKQESPPKVSTPVHEKAKEDSDPEPQKTSTVEDMKVLSQVIIHNWKEIFMFIGMGIVGGVSGLAKCVEFVGNFSLKFMHEFSFLLRTITPIVLAVIELVGKVIGGLYLLIAMMFRGNAPPPQFGRPQLGQILPGRPSPQQFRPIQPRNSYYVPREGYNRR